MARSPVASLVVAASLGLAACATPAASPMESAAPTPTVAPTFPEPTPAPIPTAVPSGPHPSHESGAWSQLTAEPIPHLYSVTQGPSGFVGVGIASASIDSAPIPALWRSADGITWEEEPYELALLDTGVVEALYQVVAVGTGFAGLGSAWYGIAVSEDGAHWSYESLGEGACPAAIASNGDTLVAVGSIGPCGMGGGPGTPAIWVRDPDGWTLLEREAPMAAGGFAGVVATPNGFSAWGTVTASADSWICQIGCRPDPALEPHANAPWSSTDGRTWRRASDPAPFAGASIEGMAATNEVTAAIGRFWGEDGGFGPIALWTSEDGDNWSSHEEPPFGDADAGPGAGIGAGGDVMAVWTRSFGELPSVTLWTTTDLDRWEQLAVESDLRGISRLGDGLIAYGTVPQSDDGTGDRCQKDEVIAGTCRFVAAAWVYAVDR